MIASARFRAVPVLFLVVACALLLGACGSRSRPDAGGGAPPAASPTSTVDQRPRTVELTDLPFGEPPPLDYVDGRHVFHAADGHTVRLARPSTIFSIGNQYALGAAGLVTLHDDGGWQLAVQGGPPRDALAFSGAFEDWRSVHTGPGGGVVMAGTPGRLVVVRPDGSLGGISTGSRNGLALTKRYYWAVDHGRVERLDAHDARAGWVDEGPGRHVVGALAADGVWVSRGGRCFDLHDPDTYVVRWHTCRALPDGASGDGRYARQDPGGRYARVVDMRTGRTVLVLDAGAHGEVSTTAFVGVWSGDELVVGVVGRSSRGRTFHQVSCDVVAGTCRRVHVPDGELVTAEGRDRSPRG